MSEPQTVTSQPSTLPGEWQKIFGTSNLQQNASWIPQHTIHVGGGCPACGYCRHCGRGGYAAPSNPYYPPYIQPWYPYQGNTTDRILCRNS